MKKSAESTFDLTPEDCREAALISKRAHVIALAVSLSVLPLGTVGSFWLAPLFIPGYLVYGPMAAAVFAGATIAASAGIILLSEKYFRQNADFWEAQERTARILYRVKQAEMNGNIESFFKSVRRQEERKLHKARKPLTLNPILQFAEENFDTVRAGVVRWKKRNRAIWEKWDRENFGPPKKTERVMLAAVRLERDVAQRLRGR